MNVYGGLAGPITKVPHLTEPVPHPICIPSSHAVGHPKFAAAANFLPPESEGHVHFSTESHVLRAAWLPGGLDGICGLSSWAPRHGAG